MSSRSRAARALAEHLSRATATPVTVPDTATEAVAQAEHDLDNIDGTDWPPATLRAAADLAHDHANPHQIAAALTAAGVTKHRDETPPSAGRPTRCANCAGALPTPARTGRPGRWCSPACRTRAWRQRHTTGRPSNTASGATTPTPNRDEYRYVTPGAGSCPTHPGCFITRCHRFLCDRAVHTRNHPGRPRRFCSSACRVAEHRRLR